MKANTVWSTGLKDTNILLSTAQLTSFRNGLAIYQETDVKAVRGAYLLHSEFEMAASQEKAWYIVADVNKNQSDVATLSHLLIFNKDMTAQIEDEITKSTENLKTIVAQADGYQLTSDPLNMFRHCSNTLFNIMRGAQFWLSAL